MHKPILFFILILLVSCTTTRYHTDNISKSSMPSFSTYSVEGHCDEGISPISVIRLENSINIALKQRGFTRSDDPDIIIQAFLKNRDILMVGDCNPYDRWEGGEQCEFNYFNYEEGTLIIDLIDKRSNEIFWHGAAVGNSFKYMNQPEERILKSVTKLFDKYFAETNSNDPGIAVLEKN